MAVTIVIESLLLLSQSPLTNLLSGPLLRSQGRIFYSGSPGEKAGLISEEGSICQTTNLSIVHTEFDKAATCFEELQFPVIYTKINVKHSQFKQLKLTVWISMQLKQQLFK